MIIEYEKMNKKRTTIPNSYIDCNKKYDYSTMKNDQ